VVAQVSYEAPATKRAPMLSRVKDAYYSFRYGNDYHNRNTDVVVLEDLPGYSASAGNAHQSITSYLDGEKYPGGFGFTKLYVTDYWTLRARSRQLFEDNLYARGLIRRLITNEINKGLELESTPITGILGLDDDALNEWTDDIEERFHVWAKNPLMCDHAELKTFGKLQRMIRQMALVSGDVLVILRISQKTGLPKIQLVDADRVQTPYGYTPRAGNKIIHGVELDNRNRQIAYHILQDDLSYRRVPAYGERSGRKIAWLAYGTDMLLDEVRGKPLLHTVLQSLREIDRYRDSEQRAALINSILALSVEKTEDKPGTTPFSSGAVRRGAVMQDTGDDKKRTFNIAEQIPGMIIDELQQGEKAVAHSTQRPNVNYAGFETAILSGVAWANEIPPEIFLLQFYQNYSASRGAVNEFKTYLDRVRSDFAESNLEPIYQEWLISEILQGRIKADGLLEAWRDPNQYHIFGAWVDSDWSGAIKPSVDLKKEVSGYVQMINEGLITRDRASKELTGTKYSKNSQRLKRENEQLAEANKPLVGLLPASEPGRSGGGAGVDDEETTQAIAERVVSMLEDDEANNLTKLEK